MLVCVSSHYRIYLRLEKNDSESRKEASPHKKDENKESVVTEEVLSFLPEDINKYLRQAGVELPKNAKVKVHRTNTFSGSQVYNKRKDFAQSKSSKSEEEYVDPNIRYS